MLKKLINKKPIKIILVIFSVILALILSFFVYYLAVTSSYTLDDRKLIDLTRTITYYDINQNVLTEESNDTEITSILELPNHTKNAFVSIEDKRFYKHNGIDVKGLARATFKNLTSFSFKEGASTISQQLIKNTHLSSEKTFKRKLIEIKLARQLEKKYSKDEILEKYLNTIYFGENCFGITKASKHYFDKSAKDLTLSESATLAGIIKAPSTYSLRNNFDKAISRRNLILNEMFNQNLITEKQLNLAKNEKIIIKNQKNETGYNELIRNEIGEFLEKTPFLSKKIKVYTTIDIEKQTQIEKALESVNEYLKTAVIINKNGEINAFSSNSTTAKRQIGSLIKPIGVYAPAIENNLISECTLFLDEKTDFNGYSPQNYGDNYNGFVSAKTALAKSLNVPAVKTLQSLGVENARFYLSKLGIETSENDNNLALSLGSTEKGENFLKVCGAYSVFLNDGYKIEPIIIKEIKDELNRTIYKTKRNKSKVFGDDTTYILNDMMKETVENGTAKKLKELNIPLRAKTGTVGNKQGNTDAYSLSYDANNLVGIWLGNEEKSLLPNQMTGGNLPTEIAKNVWKNIYKSSPPSSDFIAPESVVKIEIDKISYEEENQILKADILSPKRYVKEFLFKKTNPPTAQSSRFSFPTIENPKPIVNFNSISILLCLIEHQNAVIYKGNVGEKILVFDTFEKDNKTFIDNEIMPNTIYEYTIIPYYFDGTIRHFGKEIKLTIKTKNLGENESFWEDEFE